MTSNDEPFRLTNDGDRRKERGMKRASFGKNAEIVATKLGLLEALLRSPDGIATIDDGTPDLRRKFADNGKWRGPAVRDLVEAGIVEFFDATRSNRPSRHGGLTSRWKLRDRSKAERAVRSLRVAQAVYEKSPTVAPAGLHDPESLQRQSKGI